jgi:hypothetical protein
MYIFFEYEDEVYFSAILTYKIDESGTSPK